MLSWAHKNINFHIPWMKYAMKTKENMNKPHTNRFFKSHALNGSLHFHSSVFYYIPHTTYYFKLLLHMHTKLLKFRKVDRANRQQTNSQVSLFVIIYYSARSRLKAAIRRTSGDADEFVELTNSIPILCWCQPRTNRRTTLSTYKRSYIVNL